MRLDLLGKIMDVDDRVADAGRREMIERAVEQRHAGDRHERLGARRGQRPHPLAEPGGENHRGLRYGRREFGAQRERGREAGHAQRAPRAAAGTLASNQSRTGASAGWRRLPSSSRHIRGSRST